MSNKISANKKKKMDLVEELSQKVEKSKSMIFANHQGLSHLQLERIKKSVKKLDAEFVATKNTLLKKALGDKVDTEKEKDKFTQPTATLFIYNEVVGPIKVLTNIIKELSLPKIKFGIFEGELIDEGQINKIATLPSKEVLIAKLLGQMKAPVSGLHRALNWNLQKLVLTLNAVKDKKV